LCNEPYRGLRVAIGVAGAGERAYLRYDRGPGVTVLTVAVLTVAVLTVAVLTVAVLIVTVLTVTVLTVVTETGGRA
jgi:hypothetical protein